MYIHRKADEFLERWKQRETRKPLVIKGCRQVGKTETVRHFAASHYESLIEINFFEEERYKTITEDGYSAANIIRNISRIDPGKKFIDHKTLIFFDELQSFPKIATSLKFFQQDGRFDVICSGSLLGIQYNEIESVSVGYKEDYQMYSLDFEEFLEAKGYGRNVTDEMLDHMMTMKPFSQLDMDIYHRLFLDYCILGGMPEVVRNYLERDTFEGSLDNQRQINADFEGDIRKFLHGLDQTKVMNIYRNIPAQLAKENKKFQISKVAVGAKNKDYAGSIEWLQDSGIINVCYCLNFPELPMKGNYDENKYKLYYADTGILVSNLEDEAQDDLRSRKNLGVYKGALFENFVSEGLNKAGYPLYYFKKENSTLEMDFFVRSRNYLIPLEVKAGTNRSKSLQTMISSPHYPDISFGFKLGYSNIGYGNRIFTFPYFCTFLLKRYIRGMDERDGFDQAADMQHSA